MSYKNEDVVSKECRFAVYCPPNQFGDDLHVVKEVVHLKDGRVVPNLHFVKNFERPFFITKKNKRNHQEKKQYEHIDNLDRYKCKEFKLVESIKRALEIRSGRVNTLSQVCNSPYVYGAEEPSTTVIKKIYNKKYPDKITPWTLAIYDTETDMLHGTGKIIMSAVTMGNKAYTAIVKSFFFENRINQSEKVAREEILLAGQKYIGEILKKRNIKWDIEFVDYDFQATIRCIEKLHQWKPDIAAAWNYDFDMGKMLESLKSADIDPAKVFSDPSVPDEFKFFHYKQGKKFKLKDNGNQEPIKPAHQWHTTFVPANFYFIDAMCAYRQIRQGGAEEKYSLNAVLTKNFKDNPEIRKLDFDEAKGLDGGDWHEFMQEKYKTEYIVYNLFDCIGIELLDEKTLDLRTQLNFLAGDTDLEKFPSQPTRLRDFYSTKLLESGYVITTAGETMHHPLDDLVTDKSNWIVALNPYLLIAEPMDVTEEGLTTAVYGHAADNDVTGSYPWGQIVLNLEKSTNVFELHCFEGIDDSERRLHGINLSGGHTNAVEIGVGLLKLPPLSQCSDLYRKINNTVKEAA